MPEITNTNVGGNATNVTIRDSGRSQDIIQFGLAQLLVVKKGRVRIDVGIVAFMHNLPLWVYLFLAG